MKSPTPWEMALIIFVLSTEIVTISGLSSPRNLTSLG